MRRPETRFERIINGWLFWPLLPFLVLAFLCAPVIVGMCRLHDEYQWRRYKWRYEEWRPWRS